VLGNIVTKYNLHDKPHLIYNIDKKGLNIDQKPPKVVAGTFNKTQPSLQHFQFCRVGLSLRILISLYFIAKSALFVQCGGCKHSPVHSIRDVIFSILKDRSARHNCCACGNLVLSIRLFSCWVVPVFLT
jgi:hypothetical protein